MKAIVRRRYGRPEVLVRAHAASVNAGDWHLMRGDPFLIRLASARELLGW